MLRILIEIFTLLKHLPNRIVNDHRSFWLHQRFLSHFQQGSNRSRIVSNPGWSGVKNYASLYTLLHFCPIRWTKQTRETRDMYCMWQYKLNKQNELTVWQPSSCNISDPEASLFFMQMKPCFSSQTLSAQFPFCRKEKNKNTLIVLTQLFSKEATVYRWGYCLA